MAKLKSRRFYRTPEETARDADKYNKIRELIYKEFPPKKADPMKVAICKLRVMREAQGLSRAELAERAGMSASSISRVESSKKASFRTLERYAAALGHQLKIEFPAVAAKV